MSNSIHVVCQHCLAVNRFPTDRLDQSPKCGQCKQILFDGKPFDLTSQGFQKQVSRNDLPLVVDFWASWCGPCQAMAPAFASAAQNLSTQVRFAKLNTETEQAVAAQFGIRSIPTMVLFKNGREIARQAGAMDSSSIQQWIQAHL